MVPFDVEFDSAHNPDEFRNNPSSITNPGSDYYPSVWKTSIFAESAGFLVDDPSWKWYHSMQNLILHLTQMSFEITQVKKRIRTGITGQTSLENQYFRCKCRFLIDDPCWKWYHSMQNLILHLTQMSLEVTQVV